MHAPTYLYYAMSLFLTVCSLPSASAQPVDKVALSAEPTLPFTFTYLFTGQLNLGKPEKPIPVPGGVRLIEPILNGTISGPGINATVGYSLATPIATNNNTIQVPFINAVGTTDDGFPVYIYETGIGSPDSQVTRIQLEIGDGGAKYAALQNGYILAAIRPSADFTTVTVVAYLVSV